jgi:hypothetical protein
MRTKTLLLTAALSAFGVASSMAQTVYSVNIVGYINKTLPLGLSLIGNQLNHTPNNTVPTVMGSPAGFVTVSKFQAAAGNYLSSAWDPENGFWTDPAMTMNPGEAVFVDNNSGGPLPLTFVGEVQLSSSLNIKQGLEAYSSVLPIAGDLNVLQFPVPAAGIVSLFKFNGTGYDGYSYDSENGFWGPSVPTIAIAEGFFVDNNSGAAMTWTRNFTVGP